MVAFSKLAASTLLTTTAAAGLLVAGQPLFAQEQEPGTEISAVAVEPISEEEALVLDGKAYAERFGVPLEPRKNTLLAHVHALDAGLRARLAERNLAGSVRLATSEPAPSGTSLLTRTHPLTATLAEALVEASLDSEALPGLGIGRVGAWPTGAVEKMTRVALLRVRYKLTIHARKERLLLAEEAALVALQGQTVIATGDEARALLHAEASADLAQSARDRFVSRAKEDLPALLDGPIANFVTSRAEDLMADHARLRAAAGSASRVTVEAVLPPDVIGLFVLLPSEE